ncbi:uncharacterized protein [Diadema antillarum]|uniref:uncharacterized protein n=1 Tax=Diadema antillarum TaxID=105358 RepID=UPI003A87B46D
MALEQVHYLALLESARSIREEIVSLEAIRTILLRAEQRAAEDPEEEWLSIASSNLGDEILDNPFPRSTPEGLFPRQTELNHFICYVFRRRYGWSEAAASNPHEQCPRDLSNNREEAISLPIPHGENQVVHKNRLNEILDEMVKWYLSQPVTKPLLKSLSYTIAQAADKPVVRNQTVIHSMDWLKINKAHCNIHSNYDDIVLVVLAGLTDIWSAIRKATVSRLPGILASFTIKEAEDFFGALAKICQSDDSSWQSVEGALMAINSLLRRFQWIGRLPVEPFSRGSVEETRYFVKFGNEELSNLPLFITSQMHSIVYPLLAHPQLSVRECAIKGFTSFLSRCEFQEALASFSTAISRLGQESSILSREATSSPIQKKTASVGQSMSLPHYAVLSKDFKFLNAYEAEGLLGVCLYLIKHIPPGLLLPKWPYYFSVFSLYLMHPASTVRQATSELFRYLVVKDTNNSALLKLILQGLSADWGINIKYMSQPAHTLSKFHRLSMNQKHSTAAAGSEHTGKNQDRRNSTDLVGRSSAFTLPQNPGDSQTGAHPMAMQASSPSDMPLSSRDSELAPGSMHDGMGSCDETDRWPPQSPRQVRWRQMPFYGQSKAISITNVNQLGVETSTGSVDTVLSRAWEWREGRLFAYELIIKFLIVNHIHYLYPSFAMPPLKFNGAASTDESIIPSHKASRVSQGKPPVQKSLSHGGMSLCQAWRKKSPNENLSLDSLQNPSPEEIGSQSTSPSSGLSPVTPPVQKHASVPNEEVFTRTGSERRKKSLENKRAQTMAEGHFFNQPMTKHYSFPSGPDGNLQGGRRASHGLSGTLSLLGLTHDADKNLKIKTRNFLDERAKASLHQPILEEPSDSADHCTDLSFEARRLLSTYKSLVKDGQIDPDSPLPWLPCLQLESLTNILNQMLLQVVNSLASSRWELRRMSHQALPLVAECLRWYHPESLVTFWHRCLTCDASLVCYGAALTLKHSIQHANRMMQFLQQPASGSRRDSESCRQVSASIVVAVTQGLPVWVTIARQLMEREIIDKLSVVAMEILLLALAYFEAELEEEKESLDRALHQFRMRIFSHTHPNSAVCTVQSQVVDEFDVLIPLDGFLCCCLKDESAESYSKQLERYVLRESHCLMLEYLRRCHPTMASCTLPVLCAQLGDYQEDEDIAKALLDGCSILVTIVKGHITEHGRSEIPQQFHNSLELALWEMTTLIKSKTLDLSTLRQVLEMYQDLSVCVPSASHLQRLFSAIAARFDSTSLTAASLTFADDDNERGIGGKLVLFASNDIPASPVDNLRISDDDEEEEEVERKGSSHPLSESLALNASGGSNQTPRLSSGSDQQTARGIGVSPSSGTDKEDSDSDWDSWEEDEEDQSVFQEAIADFVRQLDKYLGPDTFNQELSFASDAERQFIKRLLSS